MKTKQRSEDSYSLKQHYQELLVVPWNERFPQAVIKLAAVVLMSMRSERVGNWAFALHLKVTDKRLRRLVEKVVDHVQQAARVIRFPELRVRVPDEYMLPSRPDRHVRQAFQLAALLILHRIARMGARHELFTDVQCLAYQAALHVAMPALQKTYAAEHAMLLYAAAVFAWDHDAVDGAHSCYLKSELFAYLGRCEQRLEYLLRAFMLTPSDDHSFLTKAQEYWSELLAGNRQTEATKFLLDLHRTCPAEMQQEVGDMLGLALGKTA